MTSRTETVSLLRDGLSLTEIARLRDRTLSTIVQHVRLQLGEGVLRPTEIILAFSPECRKCLDDLLVMHEGDSYWTFEKSAVKQGVAYEEARLYYDLRSSIALRGDIYVMISDIEIRLHDLIRLKLISEFGKDEKQWWKLGVPISVRKLCVQAREEDLDPVPSPYCYTNFIHLSDIIDSNWRLFEQIVRDKAIKDKRALLQILREVNHLRNAVMHPVKRRSWRSDDLLALKVMHDLLCGIDLSDRDPDVA